MEVDSAANTGGGLANTEFSSLGIFLRFHSGDLAHLTGPRCFEKTWVYLSLWRKGT